MRELFLGLRPALRLHVILELIQLAPSRQIGLPKIILELVVLSLDLLDLGLHLADVVELRVVLIELDSLAVADTVDLLGEGDIAARIVRAEILIFS